MMEMVLMVQSHRIKTCTTFQIIARYPILIHDISCFTLWSCSMILNAIPGQ